ncbi:MAG: hypothetical protein ACKVX7_08445 [Planctomycetota bacterium]
MTEFRRDEQFLTPKTKLSHVVVEVKGLVEGAWTISVRVADLGIVEAEFEIADAD